MMMRARAAAATGRNARKPAGSGDFTRKVLILAAAWTLTAVASLPVIFRWQPPPPLAGHARHLQLDAAYLAALVICYCIYRTEARRVSRAHAVTVAFLVLLLTSIVNTIHLFNVDRASIFAHRSNLDWQIYVQDRVMQLSASVLPHSYRFLPNSIVRWMQLGGVAYDPARDIYRLIINLLLFYAIYKYARLFTNYLGAIAAMLFAAVIYPIAFEYSAGQLTDPLSHLSFVLAFIFLETGDFAFLLSTLLIGSLAKETVLAMAGYYILFRRNDRNYLLKAAALVLAVAGAYLGVRFFVLHGAMHYTQISGVTLNHLLSNLQNGRWPPLFLLTAGALVPFLILHWKQTPLSLKRQVFFLLPVLFISSALFSWLFESHNFMPLVFVLAVVAGDYLSRAALTPASNP
jgi:hypothetical protein